MVARDIIVIVLLSLCDAVLEERKARRSSQRESRAQTIDAPRSPSIGCKVVRHVSASLRSEHHSSSEDGIELLLLQEVQ